MHQGTNPVELTDVHLRLTALRRGQPPIEGPALLETCLGIIPGGDCDDHDDVDDDDNDNEEGQELLAKS